MSWTNIFTQFIPTVTILMLSQHVSLTTSTTTLKPIRLGVPIPWSGDNWDAGPRFASGITIAVEKINKDPALLAGYNVSFVWGDSQCDEKTSLGVMTDMLKDEKFPVNALIGPACSDCCKSGSFLSDHLNVPMVSYGCAASFLSETKRYPNFARTVGVYSKSGQIFVELMKQYGWDRLAILTPTSGIWMSIMNGVRQDIEKSDTLQVSYFQNFHKNSMSDDFLKRILKDASTKAHSKLIGIALLNVSFLHFKKAECFLICCVDLKHHTSQVLCVYSFIRQFQRE